MYFFVFLCVCLFTVDGSLEMNSECLILTRHLPRSITWLVRNLQSLKTVGVVTLCKLVHMVSVHLNQKIVQKEFVIILTH